MSVHKEIAETFQLYGPGPTTDLALARCSDNECPDCARIICPHHDPYHFHHDGCPSCAEVEACSSCKGSGCQGNGPGYGGCTDCLGTGKQPV